MENTKLKSEKDYIKAYQEKGYSKSYRAADGKLVDLESKATYDPDVVYIVAEHRFEGNSNPGDMSILYVITTKDEHKGTVLVNYNPSNTTELATFFNEIPKENNSQKENILNI